jgi:hypothetical protein
MKLYAGIDLHSTNSYLAIIDEDGKRIFKEKLPNDLVTITDRLSLYSVRLKVPWESTYNCYWLVDGLIQHSADRVHLSQGGTTGLRSAP